MNMSVFCSMIPPAEALPRTVLLRCESVIQRVV